MSTDAVESSCGAARIGSKHFKKILYANIELLAEFYRVVNYLVPKRVFLFDIIIS